MNLWKVTFEVNWDYMEVGDFDEEVTESINVVAETYEGALSEAKLVIAASSEYDSDEGKDHWVRDARLVEIKRIATVDAIAKELANPN